MTLLTQERFRALADREGQALITILQPVHRTAAGNQAHRITFKDLRFEVEKQLWARELRGPAIEQRLEPLRRLEDDDRLFSMDADGLAVFLDDAGRLELYHVPLALPPRAYVGHRCYLEPLVELLTDDGRIYVLALSQHGVRLIEVARGGHRLLEWDDLPADLSEVLRAEAGPRPLHFHRAAPPAGDSPASIFHGAARDAATLQQEKLRAALRRIDEALDRHLRPERAPLVLAGTPKLVGLYREASKYPHLLDEHIDGSPEHADPARLAEQARQLVRPHTEQRRAQVLEAYGAAAAHDRGSDDVGEIVLAAFAGRVETLLTDGQSDVWGRVDPSRPALEIHAERCSHDDELTNLAAVQTLRTHGRVCLIPRDRMPAHSPLAAIYRY